MKIEKIKKIIIIVLSVMAIVGVVGLLAGTLSSSGPSGGGSSGNTQICTHASTKTERENVVEARCTESGSYDNVIYCSDCNKEMSRNTVTVDALGHTEVTDAAVAATCTTTGLTEGKSCSVCNKVIVAQNVLPIINHTYDGDTDASCNVCGFIRDIDCSHTETVTLSAVEATCTTSGLTEGLKCSVCDELLTAQTVIDPLGHTEVKDVAVAATCTTTGLTEGKHCSVCNEVLIAQTVIDTLSHTPGDPIIVDEQEPLCTREGYTKSEIRCTVCNTVISTDIFEYPKREHAFSDGVCMFCGLAEHSLGLAYTLSADSTSYSVFGIGECNDEKIIIPSTYEGLPVTAISEKAFFSCTTFTSVIIPDTVTEIGKFAFSGCSSLEEITIGEGVKTIKQSAFINCTNVRDLYFNATCMDDLSTNNFVFAAIGKDSGGTSVHVGSNVTRIPGLLFMPKDTVVDYRAFILNVDFEKNSSCESIGNSAFGYCSMLECINLPDSLKSIGVNAFLGCVSLFDLVLPENLTTIGSYAFKNCSRLTSINIPRGITSIGYNMFDGCSDLSSIIIDKNVESIGVRAFSGCSSLVNVYYTGDENSWNSIVINETENEALTEATVYYYTETAPTESGNYWHYVDGVVTVWLPV